MHKLKGESGRCSARRVTWNPNRNPNPNDNSNPSPNPTLVPTVP